MINKKKIDIIKTSKPYKILDFAIFIIVIGAAVLLLVLSYSKKGNYIQIAMGGQKYVYSLKTDREIPIKDKLTVVIKNGECYVKDSACPDKVCQHSGKIKYVNQTIVCSPYAIVIKVIGKTTNYVQTG